MTILVAAVPVAVLGTAALAGYLTYLRMKVMVARQQEVLAAARAGALMRDQVAVERERASEEAARRQALDEILSSLRVEERSYQRRDGRCMPGRRKPVVLEERLCLETLPVSGWAQQELSVYASLPRLGANRPKPRESYPTAKLLGMERR